MKKLINTIAITTLVTFLSTGSATSQSQTEMASVHVAMATNISSATSDLVSSGNTFVDARFAALLPNATDQKWTVSKDNFWVSFQNNSKNGRASFAPDGKMNYIIQDCSANELPKSFRATLAKEYAAYTVFNAIHIKTVDNEAYQIIIENAKKFVTLKYSAAGVEKLQQVKKTK